MKKVLMMLFILNLISCSSSKEIITKTDYEDLKIVERTNVTNSDTINFNELRFYNIDSAYDTMKLMYLDFGYWNYKEKGLHRTGINRKVWNNIKLFENNETFTIIADGTESRNDYFASLIVFDSAGKDCLKENHPLKEKIISFFHERMKESRKQKINYWIING